MHHFSMCAMIVMVIIIVMILTMTTVIIICGAKMVVIIMVTMIKKIVTVTVGARLRERGLFSRSLYRTRATRRLERLLAGKKNVRYCVLSARV